MITKETKVGQCMTKFPKTVFEQTPVSEIQEMMRIYGIRHLPVLDKENHVQRIISEDILDAIAQHRDLSSLSAQDIFGTLPHIVQEDAPLLDIIWEMSRHKHDNVIVCNKQGKAIGMFTSVDALKILRDFLAEEHHELILTTHDDFLFGDESCGLA